MIPIHALLITFPAALSSLPASAPARAGEDEPQRRWSIFADHIHTSTGRSIANGMVFVNNGKISLVSPGREDSPQSELLKVHSVTAGLIDASARIDSKIQSVEQSSEISPAVRVADSLDPFSIEWDRQVRSGVTTVLSNPPDFAVVGGLGIVLKTAGPESIEARTVRADAVLRGAMGFQPSAGNHPAFGRPNDFFSRRPTTRMGVEWEWRNAFYEAAASRRDEERAYPGSDLMLRALDGHLTLAIQAWTTQDIRTAVFLKEEIERELAGRPRVFLDAAAEAWKDPELIVRSKVGVVLPPFPAAGRSGEGAFMAWNVAKLLHDRGVPIALSSHGSVGYEDRLPMQAGYAIRGGLDFESALQAVTIQPAKMLGVEDRVGSIEVGKDADLVLWNGPPFEPSSRVVGVLVDGVLEVDPREGIE
ncbi:MAG: amidohydrolase family protein [Planctomycetota bacterium]